MNTKLPPGGKKVTDWVGKRVRSTREIRNGNGSMPTGTFYKVTYARSGLTLESEKCACCGASQYVRKVDPRDVEVVV